MPDKSEGIIQTILALFASEKFIIAIIGGVIGAFLSPWTKWIFEKKKIKINNRKEKIRQWREEIDKYDNYRSFTQSSAYRDLKHRLTKEDIQRFGLGGINTVYLDLTPNPEKSKMARFHEFVSEIEKEWKLI